MAKNKIKFETFLDGLCSVWRLDDKQRPVPVIKNMRFQDRIIGTRRNYEAEQAGHKVERLIRIPRAELSAENSTALRKRKSSRTRCPNVRT